MTSAAERAAWSAARPLISATGGAGGGGGRELSGPSSASTTPSPTRWRGSSPSPAARPPPAGHGRGHRRPRSAPSSASRPPTAAPARSCWHPHTAYYTEGGMSTPQNRPPQGLPLRPGRHGPATTSSGSRRAHTTVLDALLAVRRQQDPSPHRPPLTARLLRHLRDAGQRPRGPGLRHPTGGAGRPGGGRAPGRGGRGRRPGRRHGACLPAARAGRPGARPGQRARRHERREGGSGPCWRTWNASRTASSAACACRPARPPGTPASWAGRAGRRRAGPGGPTARTRRWRSAWSTTLGLALPRGVRMLGRLPGRGRPGQSCGCVAALLRTGCPGWSAATTGRVQS